VEEKFGTGEYFPAINPLNAELNPICYLLALLGAHHFPHVSRIRVKSLILRLLMIYIYIYIYIYDISSLRAGYGLKCLFIAFLRLATFTIIVITLTAQS